jgi:hypothetical protein
MASWKAVELNQEKASFHLTSSVEYLGRALELGVAEKRPEDWQEILTVLYFILFYFHLYFCFYFINIFAS